MSSEDNNVKIRVRFGDSEAEVEASFANIHEAIRLIPEVLGKLPQPRMEAMDARVQSHAGLLARVSASAEAPVTPVAGPAAPSSIPSVTIEKGDSLSDVISKFFFDQWGRSPRKLMEVREALQSYGLNYPKQSVAVALLRLAKGSRIRRFKGEGGEYVYTAATGATRPAAAAQPSVTQQQSQEEGAALAAEVAAPQEEEQLNLEVPATK
ncbi:MAG: hypothetical protein OK455_09520 [Thaumarchaeota archaeon]|nr:hypothetical protein [Nitrososphaerota archaeon]